MKIYLLQIVLLFVTVGVNAQNVTIPNECGTPPERFDFLKQIPQSQLRRSFAGLHMMRMFIHIGRNSDGTNQAMTEAEVEKEIIFSNTVFSTGDICYALVGFDYVNDDSINMSARDQPREAFTPYFKAGVFNVFVVASLKGTVVGFVQSTPADFMVTKKDGFGTRRTFIHEMGHAMGLHHTFRGYGAETGFACKELADGSNGGTCGDEVQGTPADPYSEANATASGCNYTGSVKDANNQLFNPSTTNYLSYWANSNCNRTTFTADQYTKMTATIDNNTTLTSFLAPSTLTLSAATVSSGTITYAAVSSIINQATGNYLLNGSVQAYLSAPRVTLQQGFRAVPGAGGMVRILPTSCQ